MSETPEQFSDAERAADSRADTTAVIALIVIAVVTVVFWLSGQ